MRESGLMRPTLILTALVAALSLSCAGYVCPQGYAHEECEFHDCWE
jgi:hypothetical protein